MNNKKVYNLFQIYLINFYAISFLMVPVFIVFAYLFDLHIYTSANYIVLIAASIALVFFFVGLTILLLRKERYERILKPSYRREYLLLIIVSGLGVLGFGIFYTYLGGRFFYVPHVIIPVFIVVYVLVAFLGNRFFNVNVDRK